MFISQYDTYLSLNDINDMRVGIHRHISIVMTKKRGDGGVI